MYHFTRLNKKLKKTKSYILDFGLHCTSFLYMDVNFWFFFFITSFYCFFFTFNKIQYTTVDLKTVLIARIKKIKKKRTDPKFFPSYQAILTQKLKPYILTQSDFFKQYVLVILPVWPKEKQMCLFGVKRETSLRCEVKV